MKGSNLFAQVRTGGAIDDARHLGGARSKECSEDVRMDAGREGWEGGGEGSGGGGGGERGRKYWWTVCSGWRMEKNYQEAGI